MKGQVILSLEEFEQMRMDALRYRGNYILLTVRDEYNEYEINVQSKNSLREEVKNIVDMYNHPLSLQKQKEYGDIISELQEENSKLKEKLNKKSFWRK